MRDETTGTVRFTLDPESPPTLSPAQRERLASMKDEDIDLTDIPDHGGRVGWIRRGPGVGGGDVIRLTALQEKVLVLDPDVIELFKNSADATPDRMNAILREYAEAHRKTA